MIQILPDHPAAVSPVKPDGLCVVRLTLADKGRHAGRRKAGFYKPESPAPNPSILKCLLDVQRKQLRRVSLSQADIPGEPIRNPDKINGIGRIIDPLGVPFLVPGIIKAVDHLIRIDAPVCGRPNPPAKAWDHSCVRWFCRNKLHVVPILSLIPCRSFIPSPAPGRQARHFTVGLMGQPQREHADGIGISTCPLYRTGSAGVPPRTRPRAPAPLEKNDTGRAAPLQDPFPNAIWRRDARKEGARCQSSMGQ